MIYIHYYKHDELIKETILFAIAKFEFFILYKTVHDGEESGSYIKQ
jgi:hypothetical protein